MVEKINHLDDKQIIEAVIDERGLDEALRRHLLGCAICRAQKEALQGRLAMFGEVSRDSAPLNFRKPRIPDRRAAFRPTWISRPALGFGAPLAIMIILLSPLSLKRDNIHTQEVVYLEMIQDEKFMTEIEKLEENPLPRFYVDIGDPGDEEGETQPPSSTKDDGLNQVSRTLPRAG